MIKHPSHERRNVSTTMVWKMLNIANIICIRSFPNAELPYYDWWDSIKAVFITSNRQNCLSNTVSVPFLHTDYCNSDKWFMCCEPTDLFIYIVTLHLVNHTKFYHQKLIWPKNWFLRECLPLIIRWKMNSLLFCPHILFLTYIAPSTHLVVELFYLSLSPYFHNP